MGVCGIRPDSDLELLGGPLMLEKWLSQGMLLAFKIVGRLFEGFLCRLRRLCLQRGEGQKNETDGVLSIAKCLGGDYGFGARQPVIVVVLALSFWRNYPPTHRHGNRIHVVFDCAKGGMCGRVSLVSHGNLWSCVAPFVVVSGRDKSKSYT